MRRRSFPLGWLALGLLFAGPVDAQEVPDDPVISNLACDPFVEEMELLRYLRAVSLDVRGTIPTGEELALVKEAGELPEAVLDAWLESDAFATQALRHHRKLLWNNISGTNFVQASFRLTRSNTGPVNQRVYWRRNQARYFRDGESVECRNEPAEFGPGGEILKDEDGLEGYVEVVPFWSDIPIRVCAFDAQESRYSEAGNDCSGRGANQDPGCGCGPDLRWCTFGNATRGIQRSMADALDRVILDLFREDRPYTELFTTRRAYINGPLSFFWRHRTNIAPGLVFEPKPLPLEMVPIKPFSADDDWQEVELPPQHAGILTRPAFLVRFQTNRARANRFYDAFLCQPFNPPDGGLPVADEESARNPDLQLRAGCKYCHSLLEPAAAHWGRWAQQGVSYLDPARFPMMRADCLACARSGNCSGECRNFYVTRAFSEAEEASLGMLTAYQFRRDDHVRHIEVGPRLLALAAVASGQLTECVARRAGEWLLGRPLTDDLDQKWIGELSRQFAFSDYSYRALVKAIVTDARYRRVR